MIVLDMPEAEYHAHPALSSTGARKILESPATFKYWREHPEPPRAAFDVGTAAHSKVLGVGAQIAVIPTEMLASNGAASTRDAKEFIAEARAAGFVPVKEDVAAEVDEMAEAILAHEEARALLEQPGNPEVSVFGTDPDTGVEMRARFDYLPDFTADDAWAVDLKTARTASPDGFARAVADHRYDIQQEWYLHLYALVTGDFTARMKFIVVEKEPPHLVGVHPLSAEFADMGRRRVRQALEKYAACAAAGIWPGYPKSEPLQPPTWLMFQEGAIA